VGVLALVRHGESEANASGLLAGRADYPLTERGRAQAQAVAVAVGRLAEREGGLVAVVSSPASRALDTAAAVAAADGARATVVEIDERFAELDYGDLEGQPPGALPLGTWRRWREDPEFRPGGGETLLEVHERVRRACLDLVPRAGAGLVVVVSHVSPIKAAVAWALGVGPEATWRLSLAVASVSAIRMAPSGPVLVTFNSTSHLEGDLFPSFSPGAGARRP